MSDAPPPSRSTGFQPVGRPGILPGQCREETGKMPVGPHSQDGCATRKGSPELAASRRIGCNEFTRTAQA